MRCPFCGEEMEEGRVKTSLSALFFDKVYWDSIDYPQAIGNSFGVKKRGGVVLNSITTGRKEAFNCSSCKAIIIDYGTTK